MKLSVIILTYNSSRYIEKLLKSITIRYEKAIQKNELEVLVSDNDSKDNTVSIAKRFKEVQVFENGGNYGFAKGNNLAARKAKGDILLFLNPDTELEKGDIFELIREFDYEKVGIVGGKIINAQGGNELSCGKTYTWFNVLLLSVGLEESLGVRFMPKIRQQVDHVSGAFFAIRKSLFEKLHGFDEHYFMYIEDADLCFRVRKIGYEVVFSPVATIQHIGQGSSNRTFAVVHIYKGLSYFHKKQMGEMSYGIVIFLLKLKAILLVIYGKITHNQYLINTYEEALRGI